MKYRASGYGKGEITAALAVSDIAKNYIFKLGFDCFLNTIKKTFEFITALFIFKLE